jgi:ATP-dependent DNA helicase RecQ
LRVWRKNLATTQGVPPFVIFHDSVLEAIAEAKPKDLTELIAIHGIGEKKIERFGAAVLGLMD